MKKLFSLIIFMLILPGCSSSSNVQWEEKKDEVVITIPYVNPSIEMYYAEITLESGSKIAVQLGKPDQEGIFQIKNTFGKFNDISVYTELNLE